MAELEAVKKNMETLKEYWWEDVQLSPRFQKHRQAFFEMHTESESM